MSKRQPVIAIDGPAGAGKSTVARMLADRLGLRILDTGAMYRALGVVARENGVSTSDPEAMTSLARMVAIGFEGDGGRRVTIDGQDVTGAIRTMEAGQAASELSVHPGVRAALVKAQQETIAEGGYVLEGRDTTTVVAPEADLKVFLTASIEERARRRWLELRSKGTGETSLQSVVKDVVQRDHRDYTRNDSPLCLAEDAVIVETYSLSPPEVTEKLVRLLQDLGRVPGWIEGDWDR